MQTAEDIQTYLDRHQKKELLRFLTCGSVDDGKSTLIGRLLHDTKGIYEDQLAAVKRDSVKFGTTGEAGGVDLALLTDGLKAEREQGITIDVAYRYFSTDKRKFIIADTPGHEQYTRNMATGASTCQLAIMRFPVQYVLRPNLNFRGFAGTIASGILRKGDAVMALPSGKRSTVKSIVTYDGELTEAFSPQAVTVTLEDEIDVSRGDMLVHPGNEPFVSNQIETMVVWMHEKPFAPGKSYWIKHTTRM